MKKVWPILGKVFFGLFVAYCGLLLFSVTTGWGQAPKEQQVNETPVEILSSEAIYNLVNEQRQKASVPAVSLNPMLKESSQQKCDDMVAQNYYEHTNPTTKKDGATYIFDNLPQAEYGSEDLDQGAMTTAEQVLGDWMNSPAHKASVLDPRWSEAGIAICRIPSEPDGSHTIVLHLANLRQ